LLESCLTYAPQVSEADRDDFLTALRVVITRSEHLNRFMRNFAQVVKLPEPNLRLNDLSELLDHLEVMYRAQCSELSISWVSECEKNLPLIEFDREQIEQALINIVKNAIEAIGENGELEIRARVPNKKIRLEILDNGSGLNDSARSELFTPFYTSKSSGQGLGLTLVKEILLRHEFGFDLATAEDGRTCFSIIMV
jgi:two-component system nitrogen regulation sensor histidine kinase NtrY